MKLKNQTNTRTEQIHVRLTPQDRKILEAAAKLERRTLSDYLVVAALDRAEPDFKK